MKKLLSIVAALAVCVGIQAQIVSSRSAIVKTKKTNTQWFLRAGLNIMNLSGDGAKGCDSNIGYNAMVGYQKPMGGSGAYWGMEFGLGSRGCKVGDVNNIAHNVQYSPFTFGWNIGVADNIRIDPHVGVFASCDYISTRKPDKRNINWEDFADSNRIDYNRYDVGMNVGVGVWYKRFNLDFTCQRGFVDVFTGFGGVSTSDFMIRLGIAF